MHYLFQCSEAACKTYASPRAQCVKLEAYKMGEPGMALSTLSVCVCVCVISCVQEEFHVF